MQRRTRAIVLILTVCICVAGIIAGYIHYRPHLKVTYRQQITLVHPSTNSPLHKAIEDKLDINSIKAMIDKSPSIVNMKQDGTMPLEEAVTDERPELVELLLKRGAQVDAKIEGEPDMVGSGDTALVTAVQFQNVKIAKLLIDAGASLDVKSNVGESLEQIAKNRQDTAMRNLLDTERAKRLNQKP